MIKRVLSGGAVLAAGLLLTAGNAVAGFKVCNRSDQKISVAIGYKSGDYGWTSEGWWQIESDECHNIITGKLNQRYYYVYATGGDGVWQARKGEQKGGYFCIGKAKFTFHNREYETKGEIDCESGGQISKQFLEVDTEDADNFTYNLKD